MKQLIEGTERGDGPVWRGTTGGWGVPPFGRRMLWHSLGRKDFWLSEDRTLQFDSEAVLKIHFPVSRGLILLGMGLLRLPHVPPTESPPRRSTSAAPCRFPGYHGHVQENGRILKGRIHFKITVHSWLGWHRRMNAESDYLIQFSESNSPELKPNYVILEEIYGTRLHKHGVFQRNTLNTHRTQMTWRFGATGLTLTDIYWEVFLRALFSLMEINDKVAQRSAPLLTMPRGTDKPHCIPRGRQSPAAWVTPACSMSQALPSYITGEGGQMDRSFSFNSIVFLQCALANWANPNPSLTKKKKSDQELI